MWLRNPLDDILSSRTRVAILRVLTHATLPLSGREIGRRAGVAPGHVSRMLRDLVASGLVRDRSHGRVKTYELTTDASELSGQLRQLFAIEAQRYQAVPDELVSCAPEVVAIVLFGSEARDQAQSDSDTDLLLVVERKSAELEDRLREVCLDLAHRHSLALSWHVADREDLREWEETGSSFWQNVQQDGIWLYGSSLEGLRRQWQLGKTT